METSMKIIRLTRHVAAKAQMQDLQRIFGPDIEVYQVAESLPPDSRGAVQRFDQIAEGADVVEAVLSLNLIEAILKFSEFSKRGGTLIRAITKRNADEAGNVTFEFLHYEKLIKIETVTERL